MKINIKDIMDKKNITRFKLAEIIGVTYPTIDNIYKGSAISVKFDIIERICLALECTPNDILEPSEMYSERFDYITREYVNKKIKNYQLRI